MPSKVNSKPLFFLSGLTCNEDNFIQKSCALKYAQEFGLILICPDTSPRGLNIEGEDDSWDFGSGAGFYVNATIAKFEKYQMYSYVNEELFSLAKELGIDTSKASIFGHSMGGHGALISALKNPGKYQSVSAFAPICNPVNCAWGKKAFTGYLGTNEELWKAYDATHLAQQYSGSPLDILIDQGSVDSFLEQKQLLPENFVGVKNQHLNVEYRVQEGYDHSYFFIQTFSKQHISY
ncbi:hypothetical protein HDV02_000117 [Globomyces sp. JEL0801]|nr:hypothetical protein HDV02_000117 [Globomyces sp. JEL0801]